jgi:hypothetical protein
VEIGINNKIFFTTLYFFAVSVCHTIIIVTSSDRAININISSSRGTHPHPVQIQQEQQPPPPPPPQQNLSAFSLVLCCLQSAVGLLSLGMLSLSRRLLFSWASSQQSSFSFYFLSLCSSPASAWPLLLLLLAQSIYLHSFFCPQSTQASKHHTKLPFITLLTVC